MTRNSKEKTCFRILTYLLFCHAIYYLQHHSRDSNEMDSSEKQTNQQNNICTEQNSTR